MDLKVPRVPTLDIDEQTTALSYINLQQYRDAIYAAVTKVQWQMCAG